MKPRLVIGDDHTLLLDALCKLLEADYSVVGTARNGRELIHLVELERPELMLVDISMPLLNGIEVIRHLGRTMPETRAVVITQHTDQEYAKAAFAAGARGYLLKQSAASELLIALREVLQGDYYATSLLTADVNQFLRPDSDPAKLFDVHLTPRRREVLQLVAEGKSNKQIAYLLQISTKTVEFHKAALMDQLGLRTTAELTRYAIEKGISSS
jgi:DNA-binding NarL/FixJ family response regulator